MLDMLDMFVVHRDHLYYLYLIVLSIYIIYCITIQTKTSAVTATNKNTSDLFRRYMTSDVKASTNKYKPVPDEEKGGVPPPETAVDKYV